MNFPRKCFLIAEIAQAHDGSLGTAHAYIDAAAQAGADAVKFQCHIAAEESTPHEPWRVKFSRQDASRYDYWKRMEFTEEQWHGLKTHCDDAGVTFLCSPFSAAAVDMLTRVGVPAWKVASGEATNDALLRQMAETGRPILLSTGMIGWAEMEQSVRKLRALGQDPLLFQCTTEYPCPAHHVGLNVMEEMRSRLGVRVGLSDHSGTPYPSLAAAALGATAVEVHLTFSKSAFGPDVPASLNLNELKFLADGLRWIDEMRHNPLDKDAFLETVAPMRALFMKSVVLRHAKPAGTVLMAEDLAAKKPGSGTPAERLPDFVGRTLVRDLDADHLLMESDIV